MNPHAHRVECGDCRAQMQHFEVPDEDNGIIVDEWRCPWTTSRQRRLDHVEDGLRMVHCGRPRIPDPEVRYITVERP